MAENRRQQFIDWLKGLNNPDADSLLNSLNQMYTDEWEQKNRKELRKLKGYSDLEKSSVPLRERARGEFDNYVDNPEWYIKGKAAKLGVNVEDLKKTLGELEQERKWNEGRERRKNEVENDFTWNFAPESSKQRYIDDPDATIFGKEGKYNPLSKEGARDMRDVALGGIGLAGDFLPGFNAFVGPLARTTRNAALMAEGSPYAPSLSDAGKEFLNDASTYGIAAWLQNFRRGKRMATGASKDIPFVGKIVKNANTKNVMDATFEGLTEIAKSRNFDEMVKNIDKLPESGIKSSLQSKISQFTMYGDKEAESALMKEVGKEIGDQMVNLAANFRKTPGGYVLNNPKLMEKVFANEGDEGAKYTKRLLDDSADLRKMVRNTPTVGKAGQVVRDVVLPAERVLEQGVAKNTSTLYKAGPENKKRAEVDWYKDNYSKDWELGFVPKGKDDDPKVIAYKEWLLEREPSIGNVFGE